MQGKEATCAQALSVKMRSPIQEFEAMRKRISPTLERGRESCLHLIIFQLTCELPKQFSSSLTSALNGHKHECQLCTGIRTLVMTLNQSNCLILIQECRRHYPLLKYSQMKAVYS